MEIETAVRIAQFLFTVVVGMFSFSAARRASSKSEAEALSSRLIGLDTRILTLEQQISHMPDARQIAELSGDMRQIKAELAGLAKALDPLTRSVDRINDYLLNARV